MRIVHEFDGLTDENHVTSVPTIDLLDLYEPDLEHPLFIETDTDTLSFDIKNWNDGVVILKAKDGREVWQPKVEYDVIRRFIAGLKPEERSIKIGYIDGRYHHLGPMSYKGMTSATLQAGYRVWVQGKIKSNIND